MIDPICIGCEKRPHEIEEYIEMAKEEEMTPVAVVRELEGTYNPVNGHYWCTNCYIEAGMPLGFAP